MKFFAFIMAFLILLLSVMPCADGAVTSCKEKSELKTSHQHNHNSQDACSPLCYCACCGMVTINHFIAESVLFPRIEKSTTTGFLPTKLIQIILPIWQPPQLL